MLAVLLALLSVSPLWARDSKPSDKTAPADKPAAKALVVPAVFDKAAPENVDDLRAIEQHVKKVLEKVTPATVGLRIGAAAGSGVIIDAEGHVLTAGHVSGEPGRPVEILLADGRRLKGKTLGNNKGIDSGLVEITDKGKYPFVEMGDSAVVKPGQWALAVGHPGGYRPGRSAVVRLGRVLIASSSLIRTDNTLVGGDSGGPLFDMQGKVIGIHSRIGFSISDNMHVPVNTYRETWDRLAKGESWGGWSFSFGRSPAPWLGVQIDKDSKDCKVAGVTEDSPAEKAGFQIDDVILKFDGKAVPGFDDLEKAVKGKKPGDEVKVEVRRGDQTITLKVKLEKRP
jgi:serine protease Do